jgi:hypothetical protein
MSDPNDILYLATKSFRVLSENHILMGQELSVVRELHSKASLVR